MGDSLFKGWKVELKSFHSDHVQRKIEEVNIYVEYKHSVCIEQIMATLRRQSIKLIDLEITRINEGDDHRYCAMLQVQTSKEKLDGALFKELNAIEDVTNIEEL